jgi:hypothetical protein
MTMVQLADYNGRRNVMIMSPNSQTYFSDWLDSRLNTQLQGSEIGKISWTRLDSWKSGTFQKCLEQAGPRLLAVVASSHGNDKVFEASHNFCAPNVDGVPTCTGATACANFAASDCDDGALMSYNFAWAGGGTCQCQSAWTATNVVAELKKLENKPTFFADFCQADADKTSDGTWHKEFEAAKYPWMGSEPSVGFGVGGDNMFLELMFLVLAGGRNGATAEKVKNLNDAFQPVLREIDGIGSFTYYPNN